MDHHTPGKCDVKRWTSRPYASRIGRSSIIIDCPFCRTDVETFVWSLAGGGKRCINQGCLAYFSNYGNAYRIKQNGTPDL